MAEEAWSAELFRDRRGIHPVVEFLEGRPPDERKATLNTIRIVLELTRHQPVHTIGRPQVDTLEGPIKELRATPQIRLLFSWVEDPKILLLLEADLKKGGRVGPRAIERARANLLEWRVTGSSDPLGGL